MFKFGTKCWVLHPTFPGLIVVEGIVGVSKGSHSMATPGLLALCKDGEQMLEVTRVIKTSTLVMIHESKCQPQPITTLNDASKCPINGEKIWILWGCHHFVPQDL